MKLSIGMMVKNEENNLERCLTSVQPLLNSVSSELIIVDTGSTDNTISIAKKFTDKVYFHPWENDYSKMRNITVGYAKGDWFFFIDADEELVEYKEIIQFLKTDQSTKYNGAALKLNNLFHTEDYSQIGSGVVMRLFKKTKNFGFRGVIHEEPICEQPLIMLNALLLHYGYPANDPELKDRKLKLYEPILLQAIEKDPENIGLLFYLSNTYATFKSHKEALEPISRAYEIAKKKNLNPAEFFYLYSTLTTLYLESGYYKKTEEIAQEGLKFRDWAIDLWYCLAKAQGMMKKNQEAVQSYKKYLFYVNNYDQYAGKDPRVISNLISKKEEVYLDLSILYSELDQKSEAIEVLKNIETIGMIEKSVPHKVALLLSLSKYNELLSFNKQIGNYGNINMERSFYNTLESLLLNEYSKQGDGVFKIFQDEDSAYGLLNRTRLWQEGINNDLLSAFQNLQLNQQGPYYGDIFYFLIKRKLPLQYINHHIQEDELELFFQYLDEKYTDLSVVYYDYLKSQVQAPTLEEMRVYKILRRTILINNSIEAEQYEWILDRYIEDGTEYLKQIYLPEIFEKRKTHLLGNKEEAFFFYLSLARSVEESDQAEYVRNLKKALFEYPCMKKGIEILLNRISKQVNEARPAISDEMKAYAKIVKQNVKQLIENGFFKEAEEIILSYEQIVPNDPDMEKIKQYCCNAQIGKKK